MPIQWKGLIGLGLLLASTTPALSAGFTASSPDITPGKTIAKKFVYQGFGCTGQNVSPAIRWRNAPAGTKSFAIMVHDPDAPTGGAGFWHWVVINIPADTHQIPQGAGSTDGQELPAGARQIRDDYGIAGWGGPCPPVGDKPHHYVFTVYALNVKKLEPPKDATASLTGFMINQNAIAKSRFTAYYGR